MPLLCSLKLDDVLGGEGSLTTSGLAVIMQPRVTQSMDFVSHNLVNMVAIRLEATFTFLCRERPCNACCRQGGARCQGESQREDQVLELVAWSMISGGL